MQETFELISPPPIEELMEIGDVGEFFASFIELLQAGLVKKGISKENASTIVSDVVCQISQAYGGETFYVSRKPAIFARQMAAVADLQTMPSYDVDMKYGFSRGYSQKIAQQINAQRKHREQLKFKF